MADPYQTYGASPNAQGRKAPAITPNDSTDLPTHCKGLFVTAQGNLKFQTAGGDDVTLTSVPALTLIGAWIVKRVYATGTTATVVGVSD